MQEKGNCCHFLGLVMASSVRDVSHAFMFGAVVLHELVALQNATRV